jgi:hypothetical protein
VPLQRVGEGRRLRGGADHVDEGDPARGGGGGADRLEPVLAHPACQAIHHRNQAAALRADDDAEQRIEGVLAEQPVRQATQVEHHLAAASLGEVQAGVGHAAGDGRADVDEVAVAAAAGAKHGVDEHDRVRLGPGDVLAEVQAGVPVEQAAVDVGRGDADQLGGAGQLGLRSAARPGGYRGQACGADTRLLSGQTTFSSGRSFACWKRSTASGATSTGGCLPRNRSRMTSPAAGPWRKP